MSVKKKATKIGENSNRGMKESVKIIVGEMTVGEMTSRPVFSHKSKLVCKWCDRPTSSTASVIASFDGWIRTSDRSGTNEMVLDRRSHRSESKWVVGSCFRQILFPSTSILFKPPSENIKQISDECWSGGIVASRSSFVPRATGAHCCSFLAVFERESAVFKTNCPNE